jgi:ribosomal protein S18 acetylase RimI-like enzyme
MADETFHIRKMTQHDINQVVNVHLAAFENFFLTFLGRNFLIVLYSFIVSEKSGIAFVAEPNDKREIVGFVAGTDEPVGFYSRAIRKRAINFAIAAMPAIAKRPVIILRLLRALQKPSEAKERVNVSELMSIAVLPQTTMRGVGSDLEAVFCLEAKKRNSTNVMLTTDSKNNDRVNTFYMSRGYKLFNQYITPEGRKMNNYLKAL